MARVNDRLPNFCERMLIKEGYKEHKKTMLVYSMVWSMEQIADYYNALFSYLTSFDKEPKIGKDILSIYEKTNNLFNKYYALFYAFDVNKISELKEGCLEIMNSVKKMFEKKTGVEAVILLELCFIAERIYHMTECLI